MLLGIDGGNTNAVFGLFAGDASETTAIWRLTSRRDRTADEWYALLAPLFVAGGLRPDSVDAVVLSSVVPAIGDALIRTARERFGVEPLVVGPALDLGITVRTDVPNETGTDRITNCAAAFARFGGPTIIVDLGTATKIEAITGSGDYLGGVIAPGLGLTLDALATRAARLYAVELRRPAAAIGSNTIAAVQAGVVEGHQAMIEGLVARVRGQLGGAEHVVLTGGYSHVFAETPSVFTDVVPTLTLEGLHLIYRRNAGQGAR
ncbi:MAG TPA: type III pantothenate kinase [Thermomicrobiales bacterium]|nr:type III pantothenate kinase [Thermomicrobiales bacterium]